MRATRMLHRDVGDCQRMNLAEFNKFIGVY